MVIRFSIIAVLFFIPARSEALIFTDPVAKVQRAASAVQQKIQTTYMYKTMVETYNNVQAARMTYEMAKAGYERATNPEEWKAMGEYEKMRMKSLAEPNVDPTQSSLFRTVRSLDHAADSYLMNTDLYTRSQVIGKRGEQSFDRIDRKSSGFLEEKTPFGEWSSIADAADNKSKQWDMAHDALFAAKMDASGLNNQAKQLTSDSFSIAKESDKLRRVEYYAEKEYQRALSESQSSADPVKQKARQVKVDTAQRMLNEIRDRERTLKLKAEKLIMEAQDLQRLIDENNNKLAMAAASYGLDSLAARIMQEANLSRMGEKDVWIKQVSVISFWILLISMALAFLWKGYGAVANNDGGSIPHDVILGFIAAFIFITPGSPLHVQKISREVAIISDAMEMTLYSDSLFKTQNALLSGMGEVARASFSDPLEAKRSSLNPNARAEFDQQMQKMGVEQKGFFNGTTSFLLSSAGAVEAWTFQLVASLCSYVGVLAVVISFNLRTMIYWLLVAISPLLIAMAPLPWARKTVIREVAITLYAVLMWGFIARIILLLNNNLAIHNVDLVGNISSFQSPMRAVISMLDGLTLAFLMIISPGLSYGLARGSFDGIVSGATSVAARGGAQIVKGAANTGVLASRSAGQSLDRIGQYLKTLRKN